MELTLPKFIFGVAKKMNLSERFNLLAEVNLDVNTDGKRNTLLKSDLISGDPHLGLECGYRDMVFLRAGVGNIQQQMDFNFSNQWTFMPNTGVGIKFQELPKVLKCTIECFKGHSMCSRMF